MPVPLTLAQWQSALTVPRSVEYISDLPLATEVNAAVAAKPAPAAPRVKHAAKPASIYQPLNATTGMPLIPARFSLRPLDLLHCIGLMTTPLVPNLLAYAAGWAELRYVWAFKPESKPGVKLKASDYALALETHQKAVLSDEIGIGISGYIAATFLHAPWFADFEEVNGSLFTYPAKKYQRRPDFVFFDSALRPLIVAEAKGTQNGRGKSRQQLSSAMEQLSLLPALTWTPPPAHTISGVAFATSFMKGSTRVFALDPPDERKPHPESESQGRERRTTVAKHLEKRLERFIDPSALADSRAMLAQGTQSQPAPPKPQMVRTSVGEFIGASSRFSPYPGTSIRVFRGRDLARLTQARDNQIPSATKAQVTPHWNGDEESIASDTGRGGTFVARSYHPSGTLFEVEVQIEG